MFKNFFRSSLDVVFICLPTIRRQLRSSLIKFFPIYRVHHIYSYCPIVHVFNVFFFFTRRPSRGTKTREKCANGRIIVPARDNSTLGPTLDRQPRARGETEKSFYAFAFRARGKFPHRTRRRARETRSIKTSCNYIKSYSPECFTAGSKIQRNSCTPVNTNNRRSCRSGDPSRESERVR